nr:hypothetical protein [uncultured Enterobacter sp.]
MNADSLSNGRPLNREPLSVPLTLIPPCVKAIAVRLAWAAAGDEADVYNVLSLPYYHGRVTHDDQATLSARFTFMPTLNAPVAIEDYTIMLVTVWLHIEEMYNRGKVLPNEILQGLAKKTATLVPTGCRKGEIEDTGIIHE